MGVCGLVVLGFLLFVLLYEVLNCGRSFAPILDNVGNCG